MSITLEQFAEELLNELEKSPTTDTIQYVVEKINTIHYDDNTKLSETDKKYIVSYMKELAPYSQYTFKSDNANLLSLVSLVSSLIDKK